MAEVSPEVLDFLDQVRHAALKLENSEEAFPWGSRVFFRDIKGRNFLFANEKPDYLEVAFRLPGGQIEQALALPFIEPNKYMGARSWVTARISAQEELDKILPWIETSYKLSKPIRSQADLLDGENPAILEMLDQVRQAALGFGDIEEFFPYGDRAFRSRKGQIFLYADEMGDCLSVSVRLPLGEREFALTRPNVEVPKYIGHKGWVSAKIRNQEELDEVLPWIGVSFDMNKPARKRKG